MGIAELKARLSEHLAKVRAGEVIVVTDRGHPIARIAPASAVEDEHLAELERAGVVKLGTGNFDDFLNAPRPRAVGEGSLLEALLEERREGR
ncbi:MAG: type II toxin-antitoxin system Phd/YefM family antitoxin [Solirubrobacterales bacterium]